MSDDLNVLVRRLQEGDRSAFDGIYELTKRSVYYAALAILHDPSLAEDIMQDTYMKFLQNPAAYRERNFSAYLVTISRHLAINEYQKRRRTDLTEDLESQRELPSLAGSVEVDAEKKALVELALSVLDPVEKNVVLMYNVADMTHKEIAAALGKPIGTITWTYAKALKKIRTALKKEE
ncbi:MAG TPA: RNA polymerase sigma factor [Candidatus Izemoplasmatales bacterium]|nr:RNA polymerase sigma factor [Bacillota bacterium]HRY78063.1 RNA polymerase sigma factor [Candidatus Izemoplasmatales bacterium]